MLRIQVSYQIDGIAQADYLKDMQKYRDSVNEFRKLGIIFDDNQKSEFEGIIYDVHHSETKCFEVSDFVGIDLGTKPKPIFIQADGIECNVLLELMKMHFGVTPILKSANHVCIVNEFMAQAVFNLINNNYFEA